MGDFGAGYAKEILPYRKKRISLMQLGVSCPVMQKTASGSSMAYLNTKSYKQNALDGRTPPHCA